MTGDDEEEDLPYGENFHDEAEAAAWADAAARKRPWRPVIFDHFVTAITESNTPAPRILEIGSGPGFLAEHVLDRCPSVARYTLLDFAMPMIRQSRQRLARHEARTAFVQADFKSESWPVSAGGPARARPHSPAPAPLHEHDREPRDARERGIRRCQAGLERARDGAVPRPCMIRRTPPQRRKGGSGVMRFAAVIGVLAITASCKNVQQTPELDPSPKTASTGSPADPVERCIEAKRESQALLHADAQAALARMLSGCAAVYKQPECRDGYLAAAKANVAQSDRIRMFTEPCARAYCPVLHDPKPAMCTMSPDEVATSRMAKKAALWGELHGAILERDHGPEVVARLKAADTPPDMRPRIGVRRAATSLLVSVRNGSKMQAFPMDDGLEKALSKALGEIDASGGVVLEIDAGTAREEVSRVLTTMKAAGITQIEEVEIDRPAR